MKRIRVLLGDDHALILDGVRASLQDDYEIVGEAYDGKALVTAAEKLHPDVVVVDISMPLLNGFESARLIKKALPTTKIIFLSQHLNPAYLKHALKAGASGYVLKSGAREELRQAIESALRGKIYITASFGEEVRSQMLNRSGEISDDSDELTDLQGKANKEIANILHVSIKTVEFHRARIMVRLGVRSVAELTKVALQQGLIGE